MGSPSSCSTKPSAWRRAQATSDKRRTANRCSAASTLRHDLDAAAGHLDIAIELAEADHWLSFAPLPQALRGEVCLLQGDTDAAGHRLRQAFARACQLGDPRWEGMAARGLALVAGAGGDAERAFEDLADARLRCNRLADPYVWLDGYILDAQCTLGLHEGHPDTKRWIDTLRELAWKTGMQDLTVRALLHGAALGAPGDDAAASLLAQEIANPALHRLLDTSTSEAIIDGSAAIS